MQTLANEGVTVAKLQRQIEELTARLDSGAECYVSLVPIIRPTAPGNEQEAADMILSLREAVRANHPAQTYVEINQFGPDVGMAVDFDKGRAMVPWQGKVHDIPLQNVTDYWLQAGHKPG